MKKNPFSALSEFTLERTPREEVVRKRAAGATGGVVIVCEASDHLNELAGGGPFRKIDIMRQTLTQVLTQYPEARIIAYGCTATWCGPELVEPHGCAELHLALNLAATVRPTLTIVISDEDPCDEEATIAAADRMTGRVDAIYVGRDATRKVSAFLRRLVRHGGGTVTQVNLGNVGQLAGALRRALPPPRS